MSLADQQWCPTSAQVTVLQARGLRIKGKSGTNDAYAVMQVGKEKYQTSVVEKCVAPVWKEEAAFDLPPLLQGGGAERSTLHVHVLHRALVGPDKLLGQAVINLLQLSEDKTRNKTEWFKLLDKTGKADKDRGEVLVDIQFMRNNMTASMFDLSAAGKSRSRLGKFKDKVRGKKKDSDASSTVVPSFTQVLTDSEGEGNGDGEAAASKDEKKKKHKMKSLFSPKSNLQKNMSQSMSVLPGKNSSLSGSQSSGLNVDSSEGKKKFKFMKHKRSDSKDSSSGHQKQGAAEQSNLCINGSHVYCEEPQPRTSRIGSNFSLASSGHGSMEDVPESSPPSVDSLRAVTQYSPWTEEEEEETAEVENIKEDEHKMEEEQRRKEEEEDRVRRQEEELERLAEEKRKREEEERRTAEEERVKREEEERIRMEEKERKRQEEERERLAEEQRRLEEEERRRIEEREKRQREEEERIRMEEERAQEERRRREVEERARKQEEERKLEEKRRLEEEKRRIEEEKVRKEEEERIRREEEKAEEERRKREVEERARKQQEEEERKLEEKRRLEGEKRKRMEEEERIRMEEERAQEERRRREVEERARKQDEERKLEEKRRLEEEERRRIEEEKVRKEEEERVRREEEMAEEERRREEEEMVKRREEEREEKRRLEEQERRRIEEEERLKKEEEEKARREKEEYERLAEEKRKQEEEERKRIEEEEKIRREEEERLRVEEERRQKEEEERVRRQEEAEKLAEEKRILEEQERRRIEEEERRQKEEEKMREEEERRKKEEERVRRQEEEREKLEEKRILEEQERRRIEEEEKRQREEEERIKKEEERRREEEERTRKEKEEMERLAEERRRQEEQEMRSIEEERIRREEKAEKERKETEARKLGKEKLRDAEEQKKRENKTKHQAAGTKPKPAVKSPAKVTSTNPFDEDISNNPFEKDLDSTVQQRCQPAVSAVGSKTVSTKEKEIISTQRDRRLAPQPPGRNQPQTQSQRERDGSTQHQAQNNKQSKDKEVKTVSVLPQRSVQKISPLNRSPTDNKNAQSLTQSSTTKGMSNVAKHSKRPAPARPRSVEEGPSSDPKTVPRECGSEAKQVPVVYGSNPFEDDDENELTTQDDPTSGNTGSIQWPPAMSQAADEDVASQTKTKSSKMAHAPPLPAKNATTPSTVINQNTEGDVTDNNGVAAPDDSVTHTCDSEPEAIRRLQESQPATKQSPGEEAGGKKEGPPVASRRLQPVKPLNPLEQQSVSVVKGEKDNKSTGIICVQEVQEKTKVNDTGLKGPYSQLTQEELISLVIKQEKQLSERDKKIAELELYIDNLLVRVMEEQPSILMSMNSLKKAV